jgi:hypothetical protein
MNKRAIEELAAELRGRRWNESDGKRVVDAWRKSGESAGAVARLLGVPGHRLYWWQRRLGNSAARPAPTQSELERALSAPVLLPVTIRDERQADRGEAALVAEVGAVRIEVYDIQTVPAQWFSLLLGGLREGVS